MSLRTLAFVASSPKCPPNARVNAATELLDRGWGKAAQTHTDADGGPIQIIIRQLIEVVEQSEPVVIEHDEDCAK